MKVCFKKLTNDQHQLTIVRSDGSTDEVLCETKSTLIHDLLHFALESEAGLDGGFWGMLAGKYTFADLNDRSGKSIQSASEQLMLIEAIVGPLNGLIHGQRATDILAGFRAQGPGLGWTIPDWLDEQLLAKVEKKFKSLRGHWNATKFGSTMEIEWLIS